ncbi:MAG: CapA family protein [Acidimicrobiales bacterium]|jgi:hypothetical protein
MCALAGCFVVACSGGVTRVDGSSESPSTGPGGEPGVIEVSPAGLEVATTTSTMAAVSTSTTTSTTVVTTTEPPPQRWTLLAGGDVLMDRSEPAGIDPFAGIVPSLASADIAVVNVEMAISDRGVAVNKTFVFRAAPSAATTISSAGVDVANLANNHARDFGGDALTDTVEHLTTAGVIAAGAGVDAAAAYAPQISQVGDISIAFVGVSDIVPSGFSASSTRSGIATDRERALANVRVAAEENDVVIVMIHWGIERDTCPSGRQRSYAQDLLAAGATAVLGHHPHVLQPVVSNESQVIAYSLGNFIWHARSGITGDTGVLQLNFEDAALTSWQFHPHILDSVGAPVPIASGSRFDRIVDIINGDCEKHDPPPVTTSPLNVTTIVPPTTAAPTTAVPTTAAPTTAVPTTAAPTTAAPTPPTTTVAPGP